MKSTFTLAVAAAGMQAASAYHSFYDGNIFNPNLNGILGDNSWYDQRSNYSALLNRFEPAATHVIFASAVCQTDNLTSQVFEFAQLPGKAPIFTYDIDFDFNDIAEVDVTFTIMQYG